MAALRSIHHVTGPTLTITVPPDFAGQQVEVVVRPMPAQESTSPPPSDPRIAPYLLPKPALSEEDLRVFEQSRYPLRGHGSKLVEPFAPAVPSDDWEDWPEARLARSQVKPDDPA